MWYIDEAQRIDEGVVVIHKIHYQTKLTLLPLDDTIIVVMLLTPVHERNLSFRLQIG
jgi:hypothetical protein